MKAWLAALLFLGMAIAGCINDDGALGPAGEGGPETGATGVDRGEGDGEPRIPPPPGEEVVGLLPIDLIFDGSLRTTLTRVLLVPPDHGDLSSPTNSSRDALAYLDATLQGIFAWEPAIDRFIAQHPEFSYLDELEVQVELYEEEAPATAGYDFVIGYVETSGPLFRGVAIAGPFNEDQDIQRRFNEAGIGDLVHFGHRYVLLSLFAAAPRAGQEVPDFPETHEVRGVTMHEFAHVWGLGHSSTWTNAYGPDLMNSPYPFVYGDGDATGDGGERSPTLCITSLDLFGLAHLYRWLPNATWEGSEGNVSLPAHMPYERYCDVFEEAEARAGAFLAERGLARDVASAVTTGAAP